MGAMSEVTLLPSPYLLGQPVIVEHLEHPDGAGLAACCAQPFRDAESSEHPEVPRVPCIACQMVRFPFTSGLERARGGILSARGGSAPVRPQGYA